MLYQGAAGHPAEREAFDAAVRDGVRYVVRQQVESGVDVVNDGEMSKFSFANYNLERLTGFTITELPAGAVPARSHAIAGEADDYPEFFERWAFNAGSQTMQGAPTTPVGPVCTGPICTRRRSRP